MYIILLYGPPAVGKLTVAKELSMWAGLPIFHNHLTRDLVYDIFPNALSENYSLVTTLRNDVFSYCARQNQSLIFTWVYEGVEDDESLRSMVEAIKDNGGKVFFVELTASKQVLLERVENESRKAHKKLADKGMLAKMLDEGNFATVPYDNVLKIDVSAKHPSQTAEEIIEHFGLS